MDTGFDGLLTLHSSVAAALELPPVAIARAILADGSETVFESCEAFVSWNGELRPVLVDVADGVALLGMGLLEGNELRVEAIAGGAVQIAPLS